MDHYSYLITYPYIFLLLAFLFFAIGIVSMLTGETPVRYRGIVDSSEDPRSFWWNVAMFF